MRSERLSFVLVDSNYCDYLRKSDPCVPYTMDRKANRPFVGVLLHIHGMSYYAPLSSPKPKHAGMKNQIDLLKIKGGTYGVINFNNMIPVHSNSTSAIDPSASSVDSADDLKYKELLENQLTWCNANKDSIMSKAQKLYDVVTNGNAREALAERCCDFAKDELLLQEYCAERDWELCIAD